MTLEDGRLLVVGGDTAPGCHDTLSMPAEPTEQSTTSFESGEATSTGPSSGATVISAGFTSSAALCAIPETETRLRDGAILDSATGEWTPISEAPAPLSDLDRGIVIGDLVYFWSSPRFTDSDPGRGTWMAYDVSANSWKELAPPDLGDQPYIRLVEVADGVIAFRGSEERGILNDLSYDPKADAWADLPRDPLSPSFDRFMVWTGSEVVLLAQELVPNPGADGPSIARAAAFDPGTGTWRRLPDSEVIGGYDTWWWSGGRVVNAVRMSSDGGEVGNYGRPYPHGGLLDPATGEWSALPEGAPASECEDGNRSLGPDLGYKTAGPETVVNDDLALHVTDGRWEAVPCNPARADFAYASAWAFDGVVVFGGYDTVAEPGQFPTDYKFNNDTWIWRPAG